MRNISIIIFSTLDTKQYLRTPIFDLLQKNPNNLLTIYTPAKRLAREFRFSNVKVKSFRYLWGIKKSNIVLLSNWEIPQIRNILELTEKNKIPTLFVQEGAGNPSGGYPVDIYPTRLVVWGNVARQIYIKRGIDPHRVVVTGQPRFDWYYNLQPQKIFDGSKKTLLFATTPLGNQNLYPGSKEVLKKQYDIIYDASLKYDMRLVCKLHPSDNPEFYKKDGVVILAETGCRPENYLKGYCNTCYDPKISDMKKLGEVLSSADIVTTVFSTTGLEAMILGSPVIFFDTAGFHKKSEISTIFIDRCRFALATNEDEFHALLSRYSNDPQADRQRWEEIVFDFAYKQDGKASERVVAVVEELLD